jgi:hypothetical protein
MWILPMLAIIAMPFLFAGLLAIPAQKAHRKEIDAE